MSGRWLAANKGVFVRDLLRDFCQVYAALAEQEARFAASGAISHAVLRELLGRDMRKGVFWRLKDTAHHLFRAPYPYQEADMELGFDLWQFSSGKAPGGMVRQSVAEALLDWCIGFAFHECVKLKEDAFQRQHYANRLEQMRGRLDQHEEMLEELAPLVLQTRESIQRELARILNVLRNARTLLILYLRRHGDNGLLARFLAAEENLVRGVFGRAWERLLEALYGERPYLLYLLAARASLEGGRPRQALSALSALSASKDRAGSARETEPWAEEAAVLRRRAQTFDPLSPPEGRE